MAESQKPQRLLKDNYEKKRIRYHILGRRDLSPVALKIFLLWLDFPDGFSLWREAYARALKMDISNVHRGCRELEAKRVWQDITKWYPAKGEVGKTRRTYQFHEDLLKAVFPDWDVTTWDHWGSLSPSKRKWLRYRHALRQKLRWNADDQT